MSAQDVTEEQQKIAKEIFGDDVNVNYMLVGRGLRHELTLQLIDAIIEARAKTAHWQNEYNYWRRLVPIRELDDRG